MLKSLHGMALRGGGSALLAIVLIVLLTACSGSPSADTLTIRIDDAFRYSAKTITYDGSLTGGERGINAYRVMIADGTGTIVADSGVSGSDELTLTGIAPGSYTATLQGLISGGGESVVVAENEYPITVKGGDNLTMTLDSVAEGYIASLSFKVYAPYTSGFGHITDTFTFTYSDGLVKTLSTADGTLIYEGETADATGTYWSYTIAGSLPSGVAEITFNTCDSADNNHYAYCIALFFRDISYEGIIDLRNGKSTIDAVFRFHQMNPVDLNVSIIGGIDLDSSGDWSQEEYHTLSFSGLPESFVVLFYQDGVRNPSWITWTDESHVFIDYSVESFEYTDIICVIFDETNPDSVFCTNLEWRT